MAAWLHPGTFCEPGGETRLPQRLPPSIRAGVSVGCTGPGGVLQARVPSQAWEADPRQVSKPGAVVRAGPRPAGRDQGPAQLPVGGAWSPPAGWAGADCPLSSGILVAHYLQSITPCLALGGELVYHRRPGEEGTVMSLAGKYTREPGLRAGQGPGFPDGASPW